MRTDREKYASALWRQGEPQRKRERAELLATGTPIPARITLALDFAMLHGPDVDRALGGEDPMVDEWEEGTRAPTAEQMTALADLTGMLVEWFYRPDPPVIEGPMFMCATEGADTYDQED
jgi:hypothetical protein